MNNFRKKISVDPFINANADNGLFNGQRRLGSPTLQVERLEVKSGVELRRLRGELGGEAWKRLRLEPGLHVL